jgi:hypothetical protein
MEETMKGERWMMNERETMSKIDTRAKDESLAFNHSSLMKALLLIVSRLAFIISLMCA